MNPTPDSVLGRFKQFLESQLLQKYRDQLGQKRMDALRTYLRGFANESDLKFFIEKILLDNFQIIEDYGKLKIQFMNELVQEGNQSAVEQNKLIITKEIVMQVDRKVFHDYNNLDEAKKELLRLIFKQYNPPLTLERFQELLNKLNRVGELKYNIEDFIIPKEGIEVDQTNPFAFHNLKFPIKHLPHFEDFDKILKLHGREYIPTKKLCYLQIIGDCLKHKLINFGEITTDTRISAWYVISSGGGKKNLKLTQKNILRGLGKRVEEPTSLYAEQLVGKVIEVRKKIYNKETKRSNTITEKVQVKGYLGECDLVQIDEGVKLLKSKDEKIQESRTYIRQALDPIGQNEILKKNVDELWADALRYTPKCTVSIYLQPDKFSSDLVTLGDIRRVFVSHIKSYEDRSKHYHERLYGDSDTNKEEQEFINWLKEISNNLENKNWQFTPEAIKEIEELHKQLVYQGRIHSEKGQAFTFMVDMTLMDFLLKLSCIYSAIFKSNILLPQHVKLAYMDLTEFFTMVLDFIYFDIKGNFDTGQGVKGAKGKHKRCLLWLFENQATNKETSAISIQDFWKKIGEIHGCQESTARWHYTNYKKQGWINSVQVGQYDSKVWLTFIPDVLQGVKDAKSNPYENIVFELDSIVKSLFSKEEQLTPLVSSTFEEVIKEVSSK